jgi:murein L,D-transpeptidase YafK
MLRGILFLLAAIILLAGGVYLYAHHNWNPLLAGTKIDRILVEKSARRLSIFRGGEKLKSYHVALGRNPIGAKEQEGDMKTPEGVYRIDTRNPHSDYHLALHVSYPSDEDNARPSAA